MPDLPILLRHQAYVLSGVGLVDSGASISVLPYSLPVQLGFDWPSQTAKISLAATLAQVEAAVGTLSPVRLAFAWAKSDQMPFLLGEFNFFQASECLLFPHSWVLRG